MDAVPDIVDLVLGFLALLSVVVWAIVIAKAYMFLKVNKQNKQFLLKFSDVLDVFKLTELVKSTEGSLARVCNAGVTELRNLHARSINAISSNDKREMLLHALRSQAHAEQSRLESWLAVLASIGSTSPFIGLFGTVWGIMHALKNISASGSAGLDVVAGPIGEALIATAIGIATAVPAVLAYNYFLRQVKVSNAQLENFGAAFQYLTIKSGLSVSNQKLGEN